MDFREIRKYFLDYFRKQGHEIVRSSSLIPKEDPSLLFTNAGMVQFKRLFLGEEKRAYTRAATSQKCVRAGGKHNDLENVGHTPRHHTFFEMLGNFSFGDYFKEEAIQWGWELLTEGYGLPAEKLHITVFKDDEEAYRIWEREIGIPPERIVHLGEKDNFWAMGETGPCGPCSEIHIDQGPAAGCGRPDCAPGCDCDRYLEIWNLVFTQFDRDADGHLNPLPRPNIDTGMGLERLAAVIQGVGSNYETDLFSYLIRLVEDLSGKTYGSGEKQDVAFRVIADHCRAAAFLIGDGVMPSNEGRGYVLRRIIRRAIRFGQVLELRDGFLEKVCRSVIQTMGEDFDELKSSARFIEGIVRNEEKRFSDTLHYSMKVLEEEISKIKSEGGDLIPGRTVFRLYDTYGLSPDIVEDVAREENLHVDMTGFEKAMDEQRALSKESWKGSGEEEIPGVFRNLQGRGIASEFTGYNTLNTSAVVSAIIVEGEEVQRAPEGTEAEVVLDRTPFYGRAGGQVGDTGRLTNGSVRFRVEDTFKYGHDLIVHRGQVEKNSLSVGDTIEAQVTSEARAAAAGNHTATHLLHAALRDVLGEHVKQAGSLVSPERLRFDFSHFTRVDTDDLMEIERIVNRQIRRNLPLHTREMEMDEAMKTGATAIFEEKYGDRVRVVSVEDGVSMELCGGTHVNRTGDIGSFRITGERAVAANVRRIEALTGEAALEHDQKRDIEMAAVARLLKTTSEGVVHKLEAVLKEHKDKEREIEALRSHELTKKTDELVAGAREISGVKVAVLETEASNPKELRESADRIKDKLGSGIVVLGATAGNKVMLTCVVTKDLTDRFKAGDIVGHISGIVGGKGGGRPDMAQGGGNKPGALGDALDAVEKFLEGMK